MLLLLLLLLCAPLYGMDSNGQSHKSTIQRKDISYIQKTMDPELCSYQYNRSINLFEYTCQLCKKDPYSTNSAQKIGEHFKNVHEAKLFKCVCSRKYAIEASIKSHINEHPKCRQEFIKDLKLKHSLSKQNNSLHNTHAGAAAAQALSSANSNNNTISEYATSNASQNNNRLSLLAVIATQALTTDPDLAVQNQELSSASAADYTSAEKSASLDGCDKKVTNNPVAIRKHKTQSPVNIITAQATAAAEINNAHTQYSMLAPSETAHNQPFSLDQEQLDEEIKIEDKTSNRRGRSRKHPLTEATETHSTLSTTHSAQSEDSTKRKPGRPRKNSSQQEDSQVEHTLDNTEEPYSRKKILNEVWIIRGTDIKTLEEDDGEDDGNTFSLYCSNANITNQ